MVKRSFGGRGIQARLSEKIGLAMLIWVAFALLLAGDAGLAVFPTFILIGVLVIHELSDSFTPVHIKERADFFIYAILIVFAVIFVISVWEILG
jgi:multisubunit Na+/H+ antiporter MnhG subunit